MVAPGELAPDFHVTTTEGGSFRLSEHRGKSNVVLFFYPGDFTPVCTKEACGFRDMFSELQAKDTLILGVSDDSDASHAKFAAAYKIEYPLVSDPEHALAKQYGATGFLSKVLGRISRTTVVIDKSGRVAAVVKGELSANAHLSGVQEALDAL